MPHVTLGRGKVNIIEILLSRCFYLLWAAPPGREKFVLRAWETLLCSTTSLLLRHLNILIRRLLVRTMSLFFLKEYVDARSTSACMGANSALISIVGRYVSVPILLL